MSTPNDCCFSLKWTQTGANIWLSADTFFVELKLTDDEDESTTVDAVQIAHGKNTQPSSLICSLINQSKWIKLSEQLSGLFRFYPSSADRFSSSLSMFLSTPTATLSAIPNYWSSTLFASSKTIYASTLRGSTFRLSFKVAIECELVDRKRILI